MRYTLLAISLFLVVLSWYIENPTTEHHNLTKNVLRYMKGTISAGLIYTKSEDGLTILGYSDSDFGGDTADRKSTSSVM